MHYLDTSACVALLTPESGTARISGWLEANKEAQLAASAWVHTEMCSALSIKLRTGSLDPAQRANAMVAWAAFRQGLHWFSLADDSFAMAAEMTERHDLGLRAGDALHLAVAVAHGCTLVTLDEKLAKAAPELGVPVAEI